MEKDILDIAGISEILVKANNKLVITCPNIFHLAEMRRVMMRKHIVEDFTIYNYSDNVRMGDKDKVIIIVPDGNISKLNPIILDSTFTVAICEFVENDTVLVCGVNYRSITEYIEFEDSVVANEKKEKLNSFTSKTDKSKMAVSLKPYNVLFVENLENFFSKDVVVEDKFGYFANSAHELVEDLNPTIISSENDYVVLNFSYNHYEDYSDLIKAIIAIFKAGMSIICNMSWVDSFIDEFSKNRNLDFTAIFIHNG